VIHCDVEEVMEHLVRRDHGVELARFVYLDDEMDYIWIKKKKKRNSIYALE